MKNRQIDKKKVKQVLIDAGLHKLLREEAARTDTTIKQLVEESVVERLGPVKNEA